MSDTGRTKQVAEGLSRVTHVSTRLIDNVHLLLYTSFDGRSICHWANYPRLYCVAEQPTPSMSTTPLEQAADGDFADANPEEKNEYLAPKVVWIPAKVAVGV